MSRPTHVYIVASPRPRTGKTLLARALIEFFRTDERPVAGFDLDTMDPMLARILPQFARHADINDTRGQVALFDELIVDDEKPKVVDVSAHAYETFFDLMEQIDFATEAPRR
jgi:Mrp family chromosome partitioning ATPase